MSRFVGGPLVQLEPVDCAYLDALIMRALVEAKLRGAEVPASVQRICADIHQVAVRLRTEMLVKPSCATYGHALEPEMPAWESEERLSTAQAALLAGVSPAYMRRVFARGELDAVHVRGGGWTVSGVSLALWIAIRQQREEDDDGRHARRRRALQRDG